MGATRGMLNGVKRGGRAQGGMDRGRSRGGGIGERWRGKRALFAQGTLQGLSVNTSVKWRSAFQ